MKLVVKKIISRTEILYKKSRRSVKKRRHSEEVLNLYEWTDEQKATLFDEPKIKPDSEYPKWLFDEDFLTDLKDVKIDDLEYGSDIYWKKVKFNERLFLTRNFLQAIPSNSHSV
mgnify:CR=1 FL=1